MKRYYYAQIDENNICIAVSDLTGEINKNELVPLASYDMSVLGKRYNNGTWEDVPQPEPEPTQADRIESLLNQRITETQEQAVDAYTQQLIEEGTL